MDRRKFVLVPAAAALTASAYGARKWWKTSTSTSTTSTSSTTTTTTAATSPTTTTTTTTAPVTSEPAPAPAPSGGVAYPFGSRPQPYVAGTKPNRSTAEMDAWLTREYDAWKAARVVPAGNIVAGGYAVTFSNSSFMTVSEGMGYGMLLAVLFAGHDPNAQALFDGLLAVVRARYAYSVAQYDPSAGRYLMDWRLYANGSSAGEGWNAMDGDEDIALALLMADKQWGSGGKWNYLQEGKNTIAALKSWNMAADGTTKGLREAHISRTSDYMIGHFRAFQAATGDAFWNTAIDRAYYLSDLMQTKYSPGVGLMPDFITQTTSNPIPSPAYAADGGLHNGDYDWNACRNPWRFATDYLLSGDTRWKTITDRMVAFFNKKLAAAGGDIMAAIDCGYTLSGATTAGGDSPAFIAPVMLGACIDAKYQQLVDAGWSWNISHPITGYYDGEIQLLSMVVASGNWWSTAKSGYTASTTTNNNTTTATQSGDHVLQMAPAAATTASASFAALATSKQVFGTTYKFRLEVLTRRQLRQNSAPDASEVAWTAWNVADANHFYYFALKSNGWEFGKVYAGTRKVIAAGTNMTAAIGQKYAIEVQVFGEWADVYINGQYCAYVQDNGLQGSPQLFGGRVGLCAMNSDCSWNNVSLPFADTFDAEPLRTLASGQDLANWHIDTLGSGTGGIVAG